jgi:hypothetical protein
MHRQLRRWLVDLGQNEHAEPLLEHSAHRELESALRPVMNAVAPTPRGLAPSPPQVETRRQLADRRGMPLADPSRRSPTPTPSAFRHSIASRGPAYFSRTTDKGVSWSTGRIIFDPGQNDQTIGNQIVVPVAGPAKGVLIDGFD